MRVGATAVTVASGYQAWPDFIDALNTALSAVSWAATHDSLGRVVLSGPSSALTWVDRLGYLLGMDREPLTGESATTSRASRMVPPGAIPVLGATWAEVDVRSETRIELDRYMRGHGYVFGAGRVWEWRLKMHRTSVRALEIGWCLRGKVTISGVDAASYGAASAWDGSTPGGYLEGHVVGLRSVDWVKGPTKDIADVRLLVAEGGV